VRQLDHRRTCGMCRDPSSDPPPTGDRFAAPKRLPFQALNLALVLSPFAVSSPLRALNGSPARFWIPLPRSDLVMAAGHARNLLAHSTRPVSNATQRQQRLPKVSLHQKHHTPLNNPLAGAGRPPSLLVVASLKYLTL
jgi:hypothetical protein